MSDAEGARAPAGQKPEAGKKQDAGKNRIKPAGGNKKTISRKTNNIRPLSDHAEGARAPAGQNTGKIKISGRKNKIYPAGRKKKKKSDSNPGMNICLIAPPGL